MRIVYRKVAGVASDVRFAAADYVLQVAELETQGDVLPSADSLSDAAVLTSLSTDAARLAVIDDNIRATTIGTATPKTVADLKAMDWATFSAWFDLNFDTAAKLIGLVKRIFLIVIRRVL